MLNYLSSDRLKLFDNCFSINIMPSSVLKIDVCFVKLYDATSDYNSLKAFGCRGYPYLKGQNKFFSKIYHCVFIVLLPSNYEGIYMSLDMSYLMNLTWLMFKQISLIATYLHLIQLLLLNSSFLCRKRLIILRRCRQMKLQVIGIKLNQHSLCMRQMNLQQDHNLCLIVYFLISYQVF